MLQDKKEERSYRCELHCHSEYSPDSNLILAQIIKICQQKKIDVIALTDHNEIAGAQKLQKIAPDWLTVIVGEEIRTQAGDIIGLWLWKKIGPDQMVEETIRQIKEQGGLVVVPHPFDRIRREAIGPEILDRIRDQIDCLEIFNARCLFSGDNRQAARYTKEHNLPAVVGSDAHLAQEYGRATLVIEQPPTADTFLAALKTAQYNTRPSGPLVHLLTKINKRHRPK